MKDDKDPVGRVANDGPFTLMAVVGALGAALMLGLLVSWGQIASVDSKDLDVLRLAIIALGACAGLIALAYVVRVLLAIWPRHPEGKR